MDRTHSPAKESVRVARRPVPVPLTVLVLVVALAMVACGQNDSSAATLVPVSSPSAVAEVATEAPAATTTVTPAAGGLELDPGASIEPEALVPSPTSEPAEPIITTLDELVDLAGYPSDATLGVLRIPMLGVEAPFAARFVGGTAEQLPLPSGPADVVWYDMSEWPGLGGAPGQGGNAIFSGHVDYVGEVPYAGLNYNGLGVFANLDLLVLGDEIEVDYQGSTLRYQVISVRKLSAAPGATDWGAVWSGDVPVDTITLYTCGGAFDSETGSYIDRVVLRAERI